MAALFGAHLVEAGKITPEQLVDALERQRRLRPLIGRIALTERILTVKEVMTILDAQAGRQLPFGQLGIEFGLLTPEKLQQLLEMQRLRTPSVGKVLVQMGLLTAEALAAETARYAELYSASSDYDFDVEAA